MPCSTPCQSTPPQVKPTQTGSEYEAVEDDDPGDGATTTDDVRARRHSPTRAIDWECLPEPPERLRPVVQKVQWRRDYGAKAHGKFECIKRLKRALETLRPGKWSNQRLIREMRASPWRLTADDEAIARQLVRLESGTHRVDAKLVVALARTFGVELDDLVFTHEVCRAGDSAGQDNPIAELEEERNAKYYAALRRYEVALAPLGDKESCHRLAIDVATPAVERRWKHPYRTAADDVPRDRWPEALRRLGRLLLGKAPPDRLAADLRVAVGDLERCDLRVGVGRHIQVVGPDLTALFSSPPPGDPVRRVTVVVSPAPGDTRVHVDLLPSSRLRPTWREESLDEGDLSVVPQIRRDIAWCGHWEGRWFPFLPLDAPDWLKRAAEQRAAA
jgi:hypothetical protein